MANRTVFHVDVNSAFLSWEAAERLKQQPDGTDLRLIPSAVGGDIKQRHGVILAKSEPAKRYGVKTGEPITDARKKCPDLMLVSPHHQMYRAYSKAFIAILQEYTPDVEQYSIDEAFMDMTGTELLWGEPVQAADRIREQIRRELGFTVNIGISENKLLAKMASDFQKPNRTHTLWKREIKEKMWPLPVSDLFFVGSATERVLHDMGIHTIGQIAGTSPDFLRMHLKKQGDIIWTYANGIDDAAVEAEPEQNKGYGNSTTLSYDVRNPEEAKRVLLALCENVCTRLRQNHVKAECVSVEIKSNTFVKNSHQRMLLSPSNITNEIYENVCRLFGELWDGTPIRLLGVSASHVIDESEPSQLRFFTGKNYDKQAKLDQAIDSIRGKYGTDSVKRAVFQKKTT